MRPVAQNKLIASINEDEEQERKPTGRDGMLARARARRRAKNKMRRETRQKQRQ